jgi:hypothetical protein
MIGTTTVPGALPPRDQRSRKYSHGLLRYSAGSTPTRSDLEENMGRGAGVGVMVGVWVGVGDNVAVGVIVGVGEAVQVGEGMLVDVWLGGMGVAAWVAEGLAVGFILAGALQPVKNNNTKERPQRMHRRVEALIMQSYRVVDPIKYYALVTVKNE